MGPDVVPLILRELRQEADHWFWALEAITGEKPVSRDDAGDMFASADAWLEWRQRKGLVNK